MAGWKTIGQAWAAACALAAGWPLPAAAKDLVLDRSTNFTIPVHINGARLRLKVDPAATGMVMLNAKAARRASLKASLQRGWKVNIGPVSLTGSGQDAVAAVAGGQQRLQFLWFERDVADDADGLISIFELPHDRVVLKLAEPRPGEVTLDFPVTYRPEIGLYFPYPVLGKPIPVQFSTRLDRSIATAAAGAQIADRFMGSWAATPERTPILFSVARPVRLLALDKPMVLQSLPIDRIFVRTADNRGRYQLPGEVSEDPDEIVVTGSVERQRPRSNITLGADFLSACSSMTLDRERRLLSLSCRTSGAATPIPPVTLSRASTPPPPAVEPSPVPSIESAPNRLEAQHGGAPLLEGSDQARFGLDSSRDLLRDQERGDDRVQPDPRADR